MESQKGEMSEQHKSRQPHFDNHSLSLVTERRISSKVIVCIHIYRERVRERESIGTNNTNVRVTSTNKLLGMDQIVPSVR